MRIISDLSSGFSACRADAVQVTVSPGGIADASVHAANGTMAFAISEGSSAVIHRSRLTADLDGEFVVFLIGMRINKLLHVHKWLPVTAAMSRMLKELYRTPDLGFIHAEAWFSRTIIMVQYWRSMEQLLAYAKNKDAQHLPAWASFNKAIGTDGSVGIWHETYAASPGSHESVYVNMPPFGLGRAASLQEATGAQRSAADRLVAKLKVPRSTTRPNSNDTPGLSR